MSNDESNKVMDAPRVLLPEAAAQLRAIPGILDAAVVDWHPGGGDEGRVAYVVGEADPNLAASVGVATLVRVTAVPLTDAGEVDLDRLRLIPLVNEEARDRLARRIAAEDGEAATATVKLAPKPLEILEQQTGLASRGGNGPGDDNDFGHHREPDRPGPVVVPAMVPAGEPPALPRGLDRATDTLVSVFQNTVQQCGERTCGEYDSDGVLHRIDYGQLWDDAQSMLGRMQREGAAPGDLVFLGVEGVLDYLRCFWAIELGGMVPVPLPPITPPSFEGAVGQRVRAAAELLGPRLILCPEVFEGVAGVAPCLDLAILREGGQPGIVQPGEPDDLALVLLTSGSTGMPKAVAQTHASLLAQAACAVDTLAITPDDSSFNWLPLDHVGSIHMFHVRDLVAGIDQVHCPTGDIVGEPLLWLDRLQELGASITWSPNFACGLVNRAVAEQPDRTWDLRALRVAMNSGEAIALSTAQQFGRVISTFGAAPEAAVWPAWGMSETCSAVTYASRLHSVGDSVSVGRPIPALGVRIVLADGTVANEGDDGELQVQGPVVTRGYLNNDDANAESFTADGWFRTGDQARLDDGELTLTGRLKDIVIINGVGVACQAIEETVEQVPGVAPSFAAVTAVRAGDSERAVVFYAPEATAPSHREVSSRIRALLLRQHGVNPLQIVRLDREDIPKTSIGKIQRSLLVKRLERGAFDHHDRAGVAAHGNVFRRSWRGRELDLPSAATSSPATLVVAPSRELAQRLAGGNTVALVSQEDQFVQWADSSYGVRTGAFEDYERIAQELERRGIRVGRIVHAGAFGPRPTSDPAGSHVDAGFEQGFLSAVHTLRAFRAGRNAPDEFAVLSSGVHGVVEGEAIAYERTPVGGLVRAASAEWRDLRFVHVDTEVGIEPSTAAALVDRELSAGPQREDVAYRGGQRYVPELTVVTVPQRAPYPAAPNLAIVMGGLGGVGQHLVEQVARAGFPHIVMVGRSTPPRAQLEEMGTRLGIDLDYAMVDITDIGLLEREISRAEDKFGELQLIVDATGAYASGDLSGPMSDREQAMLHTKLRGGWTLSQVAARRPGVHLVRSSSAVTYFGGAGIAAYAAGNCFAEGLTSAEVAEGRRSECVAWSIWADTGVSRDSSVGPLMVRQGYVEMMPADAEKFWAAHAVPGGRVYARLNPSAPMVSAQLPTLAQEAQMLLVEHPRDRRSDPPVGLDALGNRLPVQRISPAPIADEETGAAAEHVPAGPVEEKLVQLWQRALNRDGVGAEHNFFELGGSSLEGAALIALIEKELGYRFGFTDLMEYPTVRSQAAVIGEQRVSASATEQRPGRAWTGKAIRLNADGRPAVFCAHPLFGLVYPYVPLANLVPDRTLYGLQASGFDGGMVIDSIEEMAARYIEEMKVIQPKGPYDLCGWSLGAVIAFEMAQQLIRSGDEVDRLVIIDQATDSIERFLDRMPMRVQLRRLGSIIFAAGTSFSPSLRGDAQELLALRHPRTTLRFVREWLVPMMRVALANRQAARRYALTPYQGSIHLLHTADPEFTAIADDRLGWDGIAASGVEVTRLSGAHLTLHEPPYVQELAHALRKALAR